MRIRHRRGAFLEMLALLTATGCASVTGDRPAVAPNVRTITSIGDQALPVVSGEAGTSVAAADPEPAPVAGTTRRVSGRVVDSDGQPVPNALVRVAIDGSASGRSVATRTDEAGRFALNNLRDGSTYTVIAEAENARGDMLTGRKRVASPQRQVVLTLNDRGAMTAARVGRASTGTLATPDPAVDPAYADELPPERGAAYDPDAEALADDDPSSPEAAWRSGERENPSRLEAEDEGINPLPPAIETRRGADPDVALPVQEETTSGPAPPDFPAEDANPGAPDSPLMEHESSPMPASSGASEELIDAAISSSGPPTATVSSANAPAAPAEPPFPLPAAGGPDPATPAPADPPAVAPPTFPGTAAPGSEPPTAPPAAQPVVPAIDAPEEPAVAPPAGADAGPPAMDAPAPSTPGESEEPAAPLVAPPEEPPAESRPSPEPPPAAAMARGPTWGEIAASSDPVPDESLSPEPAPGPEPASPVRRVAARRRGLSGASRSAAPVAAVSPACEYDSRHRKLADFTLPDLDGNPLHFRDLGSELILLDFWGTWCGPCVKSIPHLVELQERYGPDRLKVVGIAYEQSEPGERAHHLADAARKLGINYPVLVGEADGAPCPVRAAFHVQVYPTMVLLDREGNVIWRDQGATPATLSRLDRVVAAKARELDVATQLARANQGAGRATRR